MQIDIHHTGIYVLCRAAGMKSEYAEITAYASQQVDDAVYGHALKFENGGVFRQTKTSDKLLSPKIFDINDALEVWMPFHFLPGEVNIADHESQICKPNSRVLSLLLRNILHTAHSPLGLYRLGIGLHSFADTYSHQDFKGFYDEYNMVELLTGIKQKHPIRKIADEHLDEHLLKPLGILAVGHGEVLTNPDIPYVKWSYSRGSDICCIDNLTQRYLPALEEIYSYLLNYVQGALYLQSGIKVKPFDFYKKQFYDVLMIEGSSAERHQKWLDLIHQNFFRFDGFDETDQTLTYNSRSWFEDAVEVISVSRWQRLISEVINNCDFYRSKPGFNTSHWAKFMHAAAEHQFIVLHKILPFDSLYNSVNKELS